MSEDLQNQTSLAIGNHRDLEHKYNELISQKDAAPQGISGSCFLSLVFFFTNENKIMDTLIITADSAKYPCLGLSTI